MTASEEAQVPSLHPLLPHCGQCLVLAVFTSWLALAVVYGTKFTVTGGYASETDSCWVRAQWREFKHQVELD